MRKRFVGAAHFTAIVLGLLAVTHGIAAFAADSAAPEDAFKQKGLAKVGSWLVIAQEAEVHTAANTVRDLKSNVARETLSRTNMNRAIETAIDIHSKLLVQIAALQEQIKAVENNAAAHNRLAAQIDALVKESRQRESALDELWKKQTKIEDSQGDYADSIVAANQKVDAVTASYALAAKDTEIKAALENYNKSAAQPLKLGPSSAFKTEVAYLKKCAADMAADGIPVRMDGGVPVVEVTVNGKKHSMIWDSGASMVSLSAETADDFGLHPTARDPTVKSTVADGRTVESKLLIIPEIRVGPFVAKDVACLVDAPRKERVPDLLGGTFQSHFLCRLDQRAGILHLTPVDKVAANAGPEVVAAHPGSAVPATQPSRPEPPVAVPTGPVADRAVFLIADYGIEGQTVSVVKAVQEMYDADPYVGIDAGNWLTDHDPAPFIKKKIWVSYRIGRKTEKVQSVEGQVFLPIPEDGIPLLSAADSFKIIAARFGLNETWIDATDEVRTELSGPTSVVKVHNYAHGRDLHNGLEKFLVVYFEYEGRRYGRAAVEGSHLILMPK